jgi:hydroxymethylpyrimidine/phosphomethylpyrimidine kinase
VNDPAAFPPRVLSIAGSDSGGGAGIQADLKAFARCGVHGMTAITAITAQNTVAVKAVYPVSGEAIVEQVRAVVEDIGVDAVKIGMLGSAETVAAVCRALDLVGGAPIVLDPVMVAESSARLLDADAEAALRTDLLPRVTVVTPNLPEGGVLAAAGHDAGPEQLVRAIHDLGPEVVVLTGGHRESATDLFFDGRRLVEIPGDRHPDGASHGSGCTHSSALAAHLALGLEPLEAARRAKQIAAEAVRDGLRGLGRGAGPVDVMGMARRQDDASEARPAAGRREAGEIAIAGIDHLVLTVGDLGATIEFYERVLGMRAFTFADGTRTALAFAGHKLNLHELGRELLPNARDARPGSADFCLLTETPPDQVVAQLRAHGVEIEHGPDRADGAEGPLKSVWIRDPDGNLVELANRMPT